MLGREPAQRGCGRVGDDGQPAPPEALDLVFYGHGDQDLAERTPSGTAGFGGSSRSGVGRYNPAMSVSSTSTSPTNRSRPAYTMALRYRCNIAHAVW